MASMTMNSRWFVMMWTCLGVGIATVGAASCGSDGDAAPSPGVDAAGTPNDAPSPPADTGPAPVDTGTDAGPSFLSVAGGDGFACAVKGSGSVWCWGSNETAQLGMAPSAADLTCGAAHCNAVPQKITVLADAQQVAAGIEFACAVRADRSVWCWGSNDLGQLGHAPGTSGDAQCVRADATTVACNPIPQKVIFPANAPIAALSAGRALACARTEGVAGDVYCWGNNVHNTIGLADDAGSTIPVPNKIGVFTGDVIDVRVALDTRHACAVRQDGTVWCWGDDYQGRIGTVDIGDAPDCSGHCRAAPTQVKLRDSAAVDAAAGDIGLGAPLTGAKAVRLGDAASCALKTDGTVWCWGNDNVAALGDVGPYISDSHPGARLVPGLSANVTKLERHGQASFATDSTGAVRAWAHNSFGDLGNGTTTGAPCAADAGVCVAPPVIVAALGGATEIATGARLGVMIKGDAVWTWGKNVHAELGHVPSTHNDVICTASATDQGPCNAAPQKVTFP
jgi:alpha-tubulin suppressor-like RCC1 family protein